MGGSCYTNSVRDHIHSLLVLATFSVALSGSLHNLAVGLDQLPARVCAETKGLWDWTGRFLASNN